ncbi:MAG: sterol desaturase family protein [Nevskia sp.]|nr:sterol desaturase family protein [Nevskia sp.]
MSPMLIQGAAQAQQRPLLLGLLVMLVLLEWRLRPAAYDWRESAASTAVALGNLLIRPLTAALLVPLFAWASTHALFELPIRSPAAFVGLLLLVDLVYYGYHRASHRLHWLWATHSVHHSSTRFNLSAAYRLGWTDLLSGTWLWLLALVALGFPAPAVLGAFGMNLLYQFFIHTEAVGRLGWLEAVFNTPAHHRVHHASNAALRDRNFGGVLIVWDRLFGSFATAPADEPLRYGLAGIPRSDNPLQIVFGEWLRLIVAGRDFLGRRRSR